MMLRASVAGAALVLASFYAQPAAAISEADFAMKTTAQMQTLCAAEEGETFFLEGRSACYGFIRGIAEFYGELVRAGEATSKVCSDEELTVDQIRVAFLTWAEANPDAGDASPVDSFLRSAIATWPCDA
ncbi:MAG: Rap1a/Tai family immunity protein [Geminicoccaceae bacterium]